MITVRLYRNGGSYDGFRISGHAGYAEAGYDIICAAVSVLSINCVNSIERLAGDRTVAEEKEGFLECRFPSGLSREGKLFVDSMVLGLKQVAETTDAEDKPYLKFCFEED